MQRNLFFELAGRRVHADQLVGKYEAQAGRDVKAGAGNSLGTTLSINCCGPDGAGAITTHRPAAPGRTIAGAIAPDGQVLQGRGSRVVLRSGSLSGLATRTKSCRASMRWGCQLMGLTGTPASCWGISWLNTLQQCVADTSRLFPPPPVWWISCFRSCVRTPLPVFVAPLHRSRAMPWLRSLLQEHWRSHSDLPPPAEHTLYGVHSCKATVLSWARQLHLDPELRRLQGHHRPSAMEGSVRV